MSQKHPCPSTNNNDLKLVQIRRPKAIIHALAIVTNSFAIKLFYNMLHFMITKIITRQSRNMMTTATTLVLTIEYHMLLSILSTSWVELPPPVLESVVVEGVVVIIVFGVVVGVIGGIVGSVGLGGMGVGGQGPGSGIVLFCPVTKQYTLK